MFTDRFALVVAASVVLVGCGGETKSTDLSDPLTNAQRTYMQGATGTARMLGSNENAGVNEAALSENFGDAARVVEDNPCAAFDGETVRDAAEGILDDIDGIEDAESAASELRDAVDEAPSCSS